MIQIDKEGESAKVFPASVLEGKVKKADKRTLFPQIFPDNSLWLRVKTPAALKVSGLLPFENLT